MVDSVQVGELSSLATWSSKKGRVLSSERRVGVWRQVALLALFLGLTVLVILEFTSAREFGQALASVTWYWIVVSALLFLVSFYLYALLYHVGLRAVGVGSRTLDLLIPLMVSIFLNTAPLLARPYSSNTPSNAGNRQHGQRPV